MTNTQILNRVNILDNLTKYVETELSKEDIPPDTKIALVGAIDQNGAKIIASFQIKKTEKVNAKIAAVWSHDWDGDDTLGAKLIFIGK